MKKNHKFTTDKSLYCFLCRANSFELVRNKLRHDIIRNVLKCRKCGLIFLEPKGDPASFYRKEYRRIHGPVIGKTLSSRELFEFNLPLQDERIKNLGAVLKPSSRVLDIGSSSGHFLHAIRGKVKECVGIELNLENVEFTKKQLGIKVYSDPIEKAKLPNEHFDLITVYHTFEHVSDPLMFLSFVRKYLKPSGHLFIEVPNTNDALLSLYNLKSFADFWYIEPHCFYYTAATLRAMLSRAGFSGDIRTTQSFSFINHINWMLTGKPQKNWLIGTSVPRLATGRCANLKAKQELNGWIAKVDGEYRDILNRHGIGGNLVFLGKKS